MGFLNKAFRKIKKQKQTGQMPRRGGGFGNLGEAIRRLNEQRGGDMGMPRMPRIDDGRLRAMPIGPGVRLQMPEGLPSIKQMPAEIDISALERLPMGDQPMLKDLPEVDSVGMMSPGMRNMQPRMMMAEGDEVIQSLDQKINNLLISRGYPMDVIADLTPREKLEDVMRQNDGSLAPEEIAAYASANPKNYMPQKPKFGLMAKAMEGGRTISDMDRQIGMMYGGEMKRYANGGEIENMLSGMDSGEQEAMGELEQMAPEMEMIDQLVNMVVQMIQQGAGEEQVISFLREQGLDDEDIGTVLQLVSEMAETEEVAAQNEIGADLEQLG
jgi:hypothetical protein